MENHTPRADRRRSWFQTAVIVFCAALLASAATVWLAKVYLFPRAFDPVHLNAREQKTLATKIDALTAVSSRTQNNRPAGDPLFQDSVGRNDDLKPERYSEKDADRQIQLTERELNALLARNTDLARKMAIDLSDDLASAKLLVPVDPDFPILGGKTLKVTAGVELRFAHEKPVVKLRGISLWGVPIPSAWLGGLKNIDLVQEFGMQNGFWNAFAAGIDDIRVAEGRLIIKLKQ